MYKMPKLYYELYNDPPKAIPAKGRLWPSDDDDSDSSMVTSLLGSIIAAFILG